MTDDEKDVLLEASIWLVASVCFGFWQHSYFAGIWFSASFFLLYRTMN